MKIFKRNYFIFVILGIIFLAPGLAAYFFYTHPHWLKGSTTNKGELLDPPILLSSLSYQSKWRLIVWSPTPCERECIEQVGKIAKVRLALGRRLYEVMPELLLKADALPVGKHLLKAFKHQDITVAALVKHDPNAALLPSTLTLFIANPDNYLVLTYAPTAKPDDIFHDIKRLLKTNE